jgi:thymidylate kinase
VVVTFSGIDASGKSTQLQRLHDHLRAEGHDVLFVWSRVGYTGGFEALKSVARRLLGRRMPPPGESDGRQRAMSRGWLRRLWLAVALLDLARLYVVRVRLARRRGQVVLCDRYLWDSLIDLRLNFPVDRVEASPLWRFLVRLAPAPDLPLRFTVPVDESVRRSDAKGEPFRDGPDVLAERARQYDELQARAGWRLLDGTQTADTLSREVLSLLAGVWDDATAHEPPHLPRE